jgi:hypothetical protein
MSSKTVQTSGVDISPLKAKDRMASDRFWVSALGEPYMDMLTIEAWLKRRTLAAEGNSLLCAKLMQRQAYREQLITELARKRGISFEQMWDDILLGRAEPLSPADYAQIKLEESDGEDAEE